MRGREVGVTGNVRGKMERRKKGTEVGDRSKAGGEADGIAEHTLMV
jgi:hypothetical protein